MRKPAKLLCIIFFFIFSFQARCGIAYAADASLSLSPSSGDIGEGETLKADLKVDTNSAEISAVDVVMEFDSDLFEVSLDRSERIFSEMLPAEGERVDNESGEITLYTYPSAEDDEQTFSGQGTVVTLEITAKGSSGSGEFSFQFSPGEVTDCNIVEADTVDDILSSVTDGTYTSTAGSSPNQSTPTPTPTPTDTAVNPTLTPTPSVAELPETTDTPDTGIAIPSLVLTLIGSNLILAGLWLVL